ncbi:MAG: matrixin family metalloprotease [Betaproteobacteria bacterium]|nr:matrixin family metalloprotease [Betaproteobacteria bacterium]
MKQRNLILAYVAGTSAVSTLMGGFVACGAQSYRISVHGEAGEKVDRPNTGASGANVPSGRLPGVHSASGWKRSLPVRFLTSEDIDPTVVKQLQTAMKSWELAVGKPLFQYDGGEKRSGGDFRQLYEPLNDGVNGNYFDKSWFKSTGKSNSVLATTIWENSPRDASSIVKADIRYNSEFYIFGNSLEEFSEGKRTIVDMESLALHELGHLLGLTHVNETEDRFSVMNPSLFIGEGMITRRLSKGDITRIRSVYGIGDPTLVQTLETADEADSGDNKL